jgi:hypothetical protein
MAETVVMRDRSDDYYQNSATIEWPSGRCFALAIECCAVP